MKLRRWFYYVLAVLALPICVLAYLQQLELASIPDSFPPPGTMYPVVFEGLDAGTREEVRFYAESLQPDSEAILVDAEGRRLTVTLGRGRTTAGYALTLISALSFWIVAMFVFAGRAGERTAGDFFWCCLLYGVSVAVGGVYFPSGSSGFTQISNAMQITILAFIPFLFLRLCLRFPRPHLVSGAVSWVLPPLAVATVGLVIWRLVVYTRYFAEPTPLRALDLGPPQAAADALLLGEVIGAVSLLIMSFRRLQLDRERRQIKWVLWGISVGVAPYVLLRTLPRLLGIEPPLGPDADRFFELAIPVGFVFAVIRHQMLDIDIVIRRSLIYGLLAATAVVLTLGITLLASREILPRSAESLGILSGIAGAILGAMFFPLRRWIGRWVDGTFFKLRRNYARHLASFTTGLDGLTSPQDVIASCQRLLRTVLRVRRSCVLARADGAILTAGNMSLEPSRIREILESLAEFPVELRALPGATALPEVENDRFPSWVAEAGGTVLMPLVRGGEVTGAILLSEKITHRRFLPADINLVRQAAAATSSTLERMHLMRVATEEAAARQRSEELNRLKSEFLDRVAHDLRTPLASITWSTANLLDGVVGDLQPPQREYLDSVQASSAYLNRLVSNLLEISRLDRGIVKFESEAVDLVELLTLARSSLLPVAGSKRIDLRLKADGEHPRVRGNSDRLLEVVVNLLDNAIKYSPPEAPVDIILDSPTPGRCSLTIRDRGPGLNQAGDAEMFDRFFQGEPSPYSNQRGFGLGLYIVREYLDRMGGSVRAHNHPDGGAEFVIELMATDPCQKERA